MKKATHRLLVLAIAQGLCLQTWAQSSVMVPTAQLPTGGKVVGGQATLQTSGSTLNVNQTSQRGVVEWDTFNIGSQAKIQFNQPSASAVTLNRVMDMNASQILGRLSATGQVFITNPNGIIFGTNAQIDVGGLVATTQHISNTDFLNGKTTFEGNGQTGSVINQGSLQAALGGYIALLAPQVRNEGVIVAREGTVALASGDKTTLEFTGSQLVSVLVDRPVMDALVENKQLIRAEGGFVVLSARSANALLSSVIKQSGTLAAPSLVQREGRILLEGGEKGVVSAGGVMNVSGTQTGTLGGRIVVTGDKVAITSDAQFDATGQAGGGKINIGGGWQGQDPSIRQANAVRVEAGARLDASAIQSGNGGEVVVWSDTQNADGMTVVAGDLKARGGAMQGDGGRIETSGRWLSTEGATGDASAAHGVAGQWLFDPYDITITSAATQNNAVSAGTWTPSGTSSNILNTSINTLLDAGTSVTVTTGSSGTESGNIVVNADITQSASAPAARLTLTANQNITLNNAVSLTKSGSKLELNAGNATTGGNIALVGAVTADTLSMNLTGTGNVTQTAALAANNLRISGTGAQVTLTHGNNNIGTLAANVASINLKTENGIDLGSTYGRGLSIDTVEGMTGVTATGDITLASGNGNIFVKQNVSTTSTTSTAIQMNAGEDKTVGANTGTDSAVNPYGPNIVLTSGKTITTGSGGRATLYTGSASGGGADLSAYIGSGSGRFRYNSDETSTNYTTPLSTGLYAIYRQNPNLTVTATNASMVYGASLSPATSSTITGYVNGDTQAQAVSTGASVAIGGSTSTAGYLTAGDHALTASGAQGNLGYGFAYTNGTLTVSKKSLTISTTASNKVYDASTAATAALSSDKLLADQVTLNNTSSTFANKNVGNSKTVTVAGLSISGTDAGNYNLTNTSATTTANITQKSLSASYTAVNKIYDGGTSATVTGSSSDIISGDTVTFTKTSATFADKNVGTTKTVTVSGIQLAGTDAGNYLLSNNSTTTTADITQKALTAAFTASNKVYDGSTTATVVGSSANIVSGDTVAIANTGATFNNKNVGTAKTVSVAGISISGADASNYSLSNLTATTTANITAKGLTISGITAANKIYDGSTVATVDTSGVVKTGLVAGDVVDVTTTGTFNNKNVGTGKSVTLSNSYTGADAGNYSIVSQIATTANVTPKTLAVTATVNDKTYDTTRTATYSLNSDQIAGDSLTLAAGTALFDTKNAGTGKTVTLSGITVSGTDASNYTLQNASTTTTATIQKADLNLTGLTANNKTYDGTVTATLTGTAAVTPLQGDVVTLAGASASTFADKNVGTSKAVTTTGISLAGADADNYNLITPTLAANITRANITVTAVTDSKTYDGTLTSSNTATVSGIVAGDALTTPSATQAYLDKNAGTNKTLRANTIAVQDGANVDMAGNYNISYVDNTTGIITKQDVTLTSLTADNKTYDASAAATISAGTLSGTVGSEALLISGSGIFSNANAGAGKTVTVSDVAQLTKTNSTGNWDNYNLATTGAYTTTATIAKKDVALTSLTADNKTYDGTTVATISSGAISGTVGSEALLIAGSGVFSDKNAANNKTVTVADVTALTKTNSTGNWDNYNLTTTGSQTTTANITKAPLTVTAVTDSKTYDGTLTSSNTATVSGIVAGDALTTPSATQAYLDKNAGTNKTLRANTIAVKDGANVDMAGNYNISYVDNTTGVISKQDVTLTSLTADNKTYDASAAATISAGTLSGTVGSEALLISGSGIFSNANAGAGKTVTVSDVAQLTKTNSTGNWDNYNLATTGAYTTTATIAKKDVALTSITADNKTYDASAAATISAGTLSGTVGSEALLISGSGSFSNANAGAGKTVTVSDVTQLTKTNSTGNWDNYNLTTTGSQTTTATIAKKDVTLTSLTADNKTYEASTAASISAGTLSGTVGSEVLLISGSGSFNNANAGAGKTVTVSDVAQLTKTNSTGNWDNYNLATTGAYTTTATIAKKDVALTSLTADNKTYDGTTAATISSGAISGTVGSEALLIAGSGVFSDKNAANNKTVTVADVTALTKTNSTGNWDNYNLTTTGSQTTTANITKAPLTVTAVTDSKTYDGTLTSSNTATVSGIVAGDALTTPSATQAYLDKNAGTNKTLRANTIAVQDGANVDMAGNYNISYVDNTTGVISKQDVTLTSLTADNKTYDASAAATISAGTLSGTVGSEVLLISGSGSFSDANAGAGKTVTVSDVAQLTKTNRTGNWDNYNLTSTGSQTTTASIIPIADNCARANATSCISTEINPGAKISPITPIPAVLSTRVDPQLVKPSSSSVATPQATSAPTSFFLTSPMVSTTSNVKALSPAQIADLTPSQLAPLIKSLDRNQLLAITEKQMGGLNVTDLDELIARLNLAAKPAK